MLITFTQIQLHFPLPGEWERYVLTALWHTQAGAAYRRQYTPQTLPAGAAAVLRQLVAGIVALEAPWQAVHVIARLADDDTAVELTVAARGDDGGRREYTSADYPELRLTDAAIREAFTQFFPAHH